LDKTTARTSPAKTIYLSPQISNFEGKKFLCFFFFLFFLQNAQSAKINQIQSDRKVDLNFF
jgi:hypothetical protein